jgi:hypothetical protein
MKKTAAMLLEEAVVRELRDGEVNLDDVVDALPITDVQRERLNEKINGGRTLLSAEAMCGDDASPMTDTFASQLQLLNLGGRHVLLISPADESVDIPCMAYGAYPKSQYRRAFEKAADLVVTSRLEGGYPFAGSLPDTISKSSDFPRSLLEKAFERLFKAIPDDAADAIRVLTDEDTEHGQPPGPGDPHALAIAYLDFALVKDSK